MWVHRGDQLETRLLLHPHVGYWVDYWLAIHADEAPPIWSARAFGLRALARSSLEATDPTGDYLLREQLKEEANRILHILPFLPRVPAPPAQQVAVDKAPWSADWMGWFTSVLEEWDILSVEKDLIAALSARLADGDYAAAAFITRCLSAELGDQDHSNRELLQTVVSAFLRTELHGPQPFDREAFADALRGALIARPTTHFSCEVEVTPTPVVQAAVKMFAKTGGVRLICVPQPGAPALLKAIAMQVLASHAEQAATIALQGFALALESLRLRYYVTAHMLGHIKVSTAAQADSYVPLPQVFWTSKAGKPARAVPRLPERFSYLVRLFEPKDQQRWIAARWHLSHAFTDWNEDVHSAAARVWQALEAFTSGFGSIRSRISALRTAYLTHVPRELASFIAEKIRLQSIANTELLKRSGKESDWYWWNKDSVELELWLRRVQHPSSYNHFSRWSTPAAPSIVFDPRVGLLQVAYRRMRNPTQEVWMDRRLRADLRLLYGLRNQIVHRGARSFSPNMAQYLGRCGAEVLLQIMNRINHDIQRSWPVPPGQKLETYVLPPAP